MFEWVTDQLGSQGTVCGGGRYDPLIETFGGKPTPGVGFAMGIERLILLLETLDLAHADRIHALNVDVNALHPDLPLSALRVKRPRGSDGSHSGRWRARRADDRRSPAGPSGGSPRRTP